MTTIRFDQRPGAYGRCLDCEAEFDSPEEAAEHRAETLRSARAAGTRGSHTIRAGNLTRAECIESYVHGVMEDALLEHGDINDEWKLVMSKNASDEIVEALIRDIRADDLTGEEASAALISLREPGIAQAVAEGVEES